MSATETIPDTDALRLVPVEPTKAMLAAGQAAGDYGDALRRAWSAMLSAAPTVPLSTPMGGEVEALREALEPFAAVADEYDDREDDTFEVWMDAGPVMVRDIREALRLSAFRRARQALAASSPSPAQGGVTVAVQPEPAPDADKLRVAVEALERIKEGGSWQGDTASDALAASSPSPAQGGETEKRPDEDYRQTLIRWAKGEVLIRPETVAKMLLPLLSASPQPEAGEADWNRDLTAAPEGEAVLLATTAGHVGEAIAPVRDDPDDDWFWAGAGFVHANHKPVAWKRLPTHPDAPPSVQPVEGK